MNEVRSLTGLRGFAAVSVFLAHLRITLGEYGVNLDAPLWFTRLFMEGGRQVDIFFVLSGFILTLNYQSWFGERLRLKDAFVFWQRRFARIYPLHAFILLLVIGFVLAAHLFHMNTTHGLDRFDVEELPAYFLLMQAWGVWFDGPGQWNPPAWSVSIEALAYVFFPLWIAFQSRAVARHPALAVAVCVVLGFALNAWVHWGIAGPSAIARGLSEFALGCALVGVIDLPAARWLQTGRGAALALLLVAACYLAIAETAFVIGLAGAVLLLALRGDNAVARFYASRPVFFLGEISYSIYLGHFLFSSIGYRIVHPAWMAQGPLQAWIGLLVIVAFVLLASTLCYYGIERPGRRWLRPPSPLRASAG